MFVFEDLHSTPLKIRQPFIRTNGSSFHLIPSLSSQFQQYNIFLSFRFEILPPLLVVHQAPAPMESQ
ncbi:hypothetical protein Hdeb2414_s0002g00069501 [Helianthus debilis subsp. tardiflorus]